MCARGSQLKLQVANKAGSSVIENQDSYKCGSLIWKHRHAQAHSKKAPGLQRESQRGENHGSEQRYEQQGSGNQIHCHDTCGGAWGRELDVGERRCPGGRARHRRYLKLVGFGEKVRHGPDMALK